jgi:hypothetical protein
MDAYDEVYQVIFTQCTKYGLLKKLDVGQHKNRHSFWAVRPQHQGLFNVGCF